MNFRFICPHCRVSVDPAALELSQSDCAEFRVCPCCDTPVPLGARREPDAQHAIPACAALPSTFDVANAGADQRDARKAVA